MRVIVDFNGDSVDEIGEEVDMLIEMSEDKEFSILLLDIC
jgi:hypothetical protein